AALAKGGAPAPHGTGIDTKEVGDLRGRITFAEAPHGQTAAALQFGGCADASHATHSSKTRAARTLLSSELIAGGRRPPRHPTRHPVPPGRSSRVTPNSPRRLRIWSPSAKFFAARASCLRSINNCINPCTSLSSPPAFAGGSRNSPSNWL